MWLRLNQPGSLGNLIVPDLLVLSGPDPLVVRGLVGLEPGARLVLGHVDGGRDLLLPGRVAVGPLTVVWTSVSADLNLVQENIMSLIYLISTSDINSFELFIKS